MEGDTLIHAWTQREVVTVQRSQADGFVYAQPIDDVPVIQSMISRLSFHAVKVSTKREEARQFDGTNGNEIAQPVVRLKSYQIFDHSLLGDIRIRIGDTEISYDPIVWKVKPHPQSPRGMSVDYDGWGWAGPSDFDQVLDYLDEHAEFWARALEVGKVDVLIVPNAELARENPGVESFVNRTIIFRDVPIHGLEPLYRSGIGSTGHPYYIMRWQPIGGHEQFKSKPRTQPVMAEILETE